MPSTAATEPDFVSSNHNLLACLALYQHRQDRANGIEWVSAKVKSLLFYYKALQSEEMSRLFKAAYYNGIIQQGADDIKKLTMEAEKSANKGKLLERAINIQGIVKIAKANLDELEAGQQ